MFFNKFPTVEYDIYENGRYQLMSNIFRQVRVKNKRIDSSIAYTYVYANEDRPDQLSYRLYDTTEYYWTFFMLNEHLAWGMKNWHMGHSVLDDYIDKTYAYHNIRLYRMADDDINYNSIQDKYAIGYYMYGETSGAVGRITGRHYDSNSLDFVYESTEEFIEWEHIMIVNLGNRYVDLRYVDWGYVLSTETVEDIWDKYDIRTGRNAVRYWWDYDIKQKHNNYEHFDLTVDSPYGVVTNEVYETEMNDQRNKVRVLRKEYIDEFSMEFRRLVNG